MLTRQKLRPRSQSNRRRKVAFDFRTGQKRSSSAGVKPESEANLNVRSREGCACRICRDFVTKTASQAAVNDSESRSEVCLLRGAQ
jgi:hypothetical protein